MAIRFQVLAVVRAHITALGGNAMVSFYMSELILGDNPHKNQVRIVNIVRKNCSNIPFPYFQGQSIISVGGDVVTVEYLADS